STLAPPFVRGFISCEHSRRQLLANAAQPRASARSRRGSQFRTDKVPPFGETTPNGGVSSVPHTPSWELPAPRPQRYATMRRGETGSAGALASLIALKTVRTNSACRCVPVFWKTDLR